MSATRLRRLVVAGVALAVCAAAPAALGATVLLIRPSDPGGIPSEALVRIHGELISAGFDVEVATAEAGAEVRAAFARGGGSVGPDAVVSLLGDGSPPVIEVWVADRLRGRSVVNRTPLESEGERATEVLAIRAIELLRSSLLEVDMAASAAAPPPATKLLPPESVRIVSPSSESSEEARWGLEVGAGVTFSPDGVGPAVLPFLRFDRVVAPWCVAQATVAGLGSGSHVVSGANTAEVAEQFALGGATFRLRPYHGVRPAFSLAAGVLHTSIEGRAYWPYQERTGAQWSLLLDVGLGARLALGRRHELVLGAHAQLAEPYPVVSFLGTDVASSGRPSIFLTLALVAWL